MLPGDGVGDRDKADAGFFRTEHVVLGRESSGTEHVSEQVVRQMAEGVRHLANAHYAIATTGIAGPTGGTPEYPVGSVWIAVSSPLRTTARLIHAKGDRTQIIREAGTAAIELLEEELLAAQPGK